MTPWRRLARIALPAVLLVFTFVGCSVLTGPVGGVGTSIGSQRLRLSQTTLSMTWLVQSALAPRVETSTTPASLPSPSSSASPTTLLLDTVTPLERAEWTKVAICEEGGWIGWSGPSYPDSLGINATNWWAYGGTSDVSEDAQIMVAERIQSDPPDQDGCDGSW